MIRVKNELNWYKFLKGKTFLNSVGEKEIEYISKCWQMFDSDWIHKESCYSCGWKSTHIFQYCLHFWAALWENKQTLVQMYFKRRQQTFGRFLLQVDWPKNYRDISNKHIRKINIFTVPPQFWTIRLNSITMSTPNP